MEKKHITLKNGDSIEIETGGETIVVEAAEQKKTTPSDHASKQVGEFMEKVAENLSNMKGEK